MKTATDAGAALCKNSLSVRPACTAGGTEAGVGLDALVDYRWEVALGDHPLSADELAALAELKTIQEVLSLAAFVLVAWVMFGIKPGPSQLLGFALIAGGAFMIFKNPLG